jgi:hypothetical protein
LSHEIRAVVLAYPDPILCKSQTKLQAEIVEDLLLQL